MGPPELGLPRMAAQPSRCALCECFCLLLQFWLLGVSLHETIVGPQRPSSSADPACVVTGQHTQKMGSSKCRRLGVPLLVEDITPARLDAAAQSRARFGCVHVVSG